LTIIIRWLIDIHIISSLMFSTDGVTNCQQVILGNLLKVISVATLPVTVALPPIDDIAICLTPAVLHASIWVGIVVDFALPHGRTEARFIRVFLADAFCNITVFACLTHHLFSCRDYFLRRLPCAVLFDCVDGGMCRLS
jgi:hypothetical protein